MQREVPAVTEDRRRSRLAAPGGTVVRTHRWRAPLAALSTDGGRSRRGGRQGAARPDAGPAGVRDPDDLPAAPRWLRLDGRARHWSGPIPPVSAATGRSPPRPSARGSLPLCMMLETLQVVFLAPSATAGAISMEREKQTLELLVVTPITSLAIVLGKLVSALVYVWLLIAASIPLTAVVFVYGGVAPDDVLRGYLVLIVTALGLGAFGLFCSSLVKRTQAATAITIFGVLTMTIGSIFVLIFWQAMATGDAERGRWPDQGQPPGGDRIPEPLSGPGRRAVRDRRDLWHLVFDRGVGCSRPRTSRSSRVRRFRPRCRWSLRPSVGTGSFAPSRTADSRSPTVADFGIGRDAIWPESVATWLVVSLVLLVLTVQFVSPDPALAPSSSFAPSPPATRTGIGHHEHPAVCPGSAAFARPQAKVRPAGSRPIHARLWRGRWIRSCWTCAPRSSPIGAACGCAGWSAAPGSRLPPSRLPSSTLWTLARLVPLPVAPVIGASLPLLGLLGWLIAVIRARPEPRRDRAGPRCRGPPGRSALECARAGGRGFPCLGRSGRGPERRCCTHPAPAPSCLRRSGRVRSTCAAPAARRLGGRHAARAARVVRARAGPAAAHHHADRDALLLAPVLLLPNPQDAVIAQQQALHEAGRAPGGAN